MLCRYIIFAIKTNIKKMFAYKIDFTFNVISALIWMFAGVFNIFVVFTLLDSFDGWNYYEVLFLYGMWSLTFSIYNIFGSGILDLDKLIITGNLDLYLTKPISPILQIIMSRINIMGVGFFLFGIIMIVYSSGKLSIHLSIGTILYVILSSLSGGLIIFDACLLIASLGFWFTQMGDIVRVTYDIHKFAQYPVSIYSSVIKFILIAIFPFAWTNYYPISFILKKQNLLFGILPFLICIIYHFIAIRVWKAGLKKYEGSSA